jgi:ADP-ribose pyrophosphatase
MENLVESNLVLEGKNFSFKQDKVMLPNGRITLRDIVQHPGAVGILAITDLNEVILVEQFRYATGKKLLEIPAGTIEQNENIEACVFRELEEETGYKAKKTRKLVSCYTSPGYSSEVLHIYLAEDLVETTSKAEEDEILEVVKMSLEDALELVKSNQIIDAKTILALQYYMNS